MRRRLAAWLSHARIARMVAVVAVVGAGVSVASAPVGVAAPLGTLACQPDVQLFITSADELLELDGHQEPETGVGEWSGRQTIGEGWAGNVRVGPDGVVYSFTPEGEVRRFRWLGEEWENGGGYDTIATGWNDWGTDAFRNRMTVDRRGDFYGLAADNTLRWWRYDLATGNWTERVLDYGWGDRFDLIVAAGVGVLYARENDGDVFRFQYDTVSQRLVEFGQVATGWGDATDIASPGGDLLYVAHGGSGELTWHRYLGDGKWAAGSGRLVGEGIPDDWRLEMAPDGCQLTPNGTPSRPVTSPVPHAAASLLYTSTGRLHYSYVDGNGRMVNAQATDLAGNAPIGFSVIPSFRDVTGVPAAGEYADGRVQLLALGTDAETRANTQVSPIGAWSSTISVGGFSKGSATLRRQADKSLIAWAVDSDGCAWWTAQRALNEELRPWRLSHCGDYAPLPPSVATEGTTSYLTFLTRAGVYQVLAAPNGVCCTGSSLGGSGFSSPAATVINGAGKLQVFARGADGQIYTQTETAAGFPKTWTAIAGLTAGGAPSAVHAPNGVIEVVARGADGYVYNTGQQAPGSGAFRPWRDITDRTEKSSTDPTVAALPDKNLWVVAFRNEDDVPKLRKAVPPAASARPDGDGAARFVDVPVQAAK